MATRYQCEGCKEFFETNDNGACPKCETKALFPVEDADAGHEAAIPQERRKG